MKIENRQGPTLFLVALLLTASRLEDVIRKRMRDATVATHAVRIPRGSDRVESLRLLALLREECWRLCVAVAAAPRVQRAMGIVAVGTHERILSRGGRTDRVDELAGIRLGHHVGVTPARHATFRDLGA